MSTFFQRTTAPQLPFERHPTYNKYGIDVSEQRASVARNLRKQRRIKQALAEGLAMVFFEKEFGHKPSDEEKREIIPQHHTTTKRIKVQVTTIEVDLDSLFSE